LSNEYTLPVVLLLSDVWVVGNAVIEDCGVSDFSDSIDEICDDG
jgi:hypothetical protein